MIKTVETRPVRSRKALCDAIMRSYSVRRDIATGPTKIQLALMRAIEEGK